MKINNRQIQLMGAMTCLALSLLALLGVAIETERKVMQPYIIEDTIGDATFSFFIGQQYVSYPGQEITLSWNVNGIQELYRNGTGRIGAYEEVYRTYYCEQVVWTGTTIDGTAFEFAFQPTYTFHEPFFIAGILIALVFFLFAGILYPLPILRPIITETGALFNASGKAHAGYYLPVLITAILSYLLATSVDGSCDSSRATIPLSQSSLLYEGIFVSSLFLLFIGLFSQHFRQINVVLSVYLLGILAYILVGSLREWQPSTAVTVEWLIVSVLAIIIIVGQRLDRNTMARELRIIALFVLAVLFIHGNFALRSNEFYVPESNQLRDLSGDPGVLDVYLNVHDYYYGRQLVLNISEDFDLIPFRTNLFRVWSRVGSIRQDNPAMYLTADEVADILANDPENLTHSDNVPKRRLIDPFR